MQNVYGFFHVYHPGLVLAILLAVVMLFFGTYFILSDFLPVPSKKARKAVLSMTNTETSLSESITVPLANKLVVFLDRKKYGWYESLKEGWNSNLQKKLYSANIHYTPEFYVIKAFLESVLVCALAIPMYFITPIISVVCIALGISVYFKRLQDLDEIIKKKSEKIDAELVLFANTIKQQLATTRDIIKILQDYRKISGQEFLHELDMTIADMKTGSYENALRNLEMRVHSSGLSEIIHGLLAVIRGNDQQNFFEMLVHDLQVNERERLKRIALKRPEKLKPITFLLVGSFLLMYLYVIGYQIVVQMQTIF